MSENITVPSQSSLLNRIATEWNDAEAIQKEIAAHRRPWAEVASPFVAPRTPTERLLVDIWAEALGLEQVGVDDNFFQLGGHSLLATQILARVRDAFQVELPLDVLFTGSFTIAELAASIEQYQIGQADLEEIAAVIKELNQLSDDEIKAMLAT